MREPTEAESNVALALARCDGINPSPGAVKQYLYRARASIRALHSPTADMMDKAGLVENWGAQMGAWEFADEFHRDWWKSAIDAASPP